MRFKYLGLILDSCSTWKVHIKYLRDKLIRNVRLFYVMKSVCYPELLKTIYYVLVSSELEYGLCVWGGRYISSLQPLIVLQKCFIRIILKRPRLEHTKQLFIMLKVLPLRNLYIFKVLREFFARSGNTESVESKGCQTRRLFDVVRDVVVPKPKLTLYKKFYTYLASKLYNSLPVTIKRGTTQNLFQKAVKVFLIKHNNVETLLGLLESNMHVQAPNR